MANEDRAYLEWIRKQPCCLCERERDVQAHHHTNGTLSPVFPVEGEPLASNALPRGLGERAHDHWAMPLCGGPFGCHRALHDRFGVFDLDREELRTWQDAQVRALRARYLDKETF